MKELSGFATGIIFCAWFVSATPDQVALIRLPATLFVAGYWAVVGWSFFRRRVWLGDIGTNPTPPG